VIAVREGERFVVRLDLERIGAAVPLIAPVFRGTPQYECEQLGALLGCRITLKVESLNPVRCFKGRVRPLHGGRLGHGQPPEAAADAGARGDRTAVRLSVLPLAGRGALLPCGRPLH
jgi:threonine dehydratase